MDVVGIQGLMGYPVGSHIVSQYPPGMPALLALFSLFGWKFALGTNLFVHLATFWVVACILRKIKVPTVFALLYLLDPTAVLYSRTLCSDMVAALCVTLALYFQLVRRPGWCGACLGISFVFRTANLIAIPLMALAYFLVDYLQVRDGRKTAPLHAAISAGRMLLGAGPPLILAYVYQALVQHGGWSRYGGGFPPPSLAYLPQVFPKYVLYLSVIYPGMVFAPLLYRGAGRTSIFLISYGFLFFYGSYYFMNMGRSFAEDVVAAPRLMIVVLPLFIVAYSDIIWRLVGATDSKLRLMAGALCAAILFLVAIGLQKRHQQYLHEMDNARTAILTRVQPQDVLLCNIHVAKLFHPAWGTRHYFLFGAAWKYDVNLRSAEDAIRAGLTRRNGSVFLADWSRDYRPETSDEVRCISDLQRRFVVREITPGAETGLPQGMVLIEFLAERAK